MMIVINHNFVVEYIKGLHHDFENGAIMPFKIRLFIITILLTSITFFLASNALAIEEKKDRGHRGPIGKDVLHSKLKEIHDKRGEWVEGYVIEGKDIISIIEKTDIDISIKNSIIKGGLDFTKLPKVQLDRLKYPDGWSEDEKEKWRTKQTKDKRFCQVTNNIFIRNSDIRSARSQNEGFSVNATQTFFSGETYFPSTTFSGKADFSSATFSREAYFPSANFSEEAYFPSATFSEEADFYSATFSGKADFSSATFSGKADFSSAKFSRETDFFFATFSGKAYFESATFSGKANFYSANFSREADFFFVTFSREADFFFANFSEEADFSSATFSREADFSSANFSELAKFDSTNFSGKANFFFATFSREAEFYSTNFKGMAMFDSVNFSEEADFYSAKFSGWAYFRSTTFSGKADFSSAKFSREADFSMASFIKLAYFNGARFLSSLLFKNVDFKEYADLRNTRIRRLDCNSVDSPTIIKGRLDFRNSIILEAHIQDFIFEKNVYFSDSKFGVFVEEEKKESVSKTDKKPNKRNTKVESSVATVFRFVTFESYADFKRTEFLGNTAFENVNFIQDANFTDADFKARKDGSKQNFSLSYLNFKNLFIKWDQLPNIRCWVTDSSGRIKSFVEIKEEQKKKPESGQQRRYEKKDKELEPLSHVFKGLEANFRTINQLSDANQAYYHRKKAELKETKNGDNSWLMTQREAEWIFWGIPCGYGTKIYWIIGWSALITLLFAVIYSIKGELNRQPHPKTKQEFNFKQRLFDFPKEYCSKNSMVEVKNHSHSARKFINALRFSAVILFKVGYRDTTISGKILGIDYKYILWLEWALGYYILIALVVTLSNTLPIVINWLITGVF